MAERPWLPGSYPEPGYPAHLRKPTAEALRTPGARAIATPDPGHEGHYTIGLPNNVVQSLYSCLEGENREDLVREEYYRINQPPAPIDTTPAPVIATLTPPDAVASGTAPIMLTVAGAEFRDNSKVLFNGVVQPTMYYSSSKLVGEVTKLAIGYYPVVVKTGDKMSNTLTFRFR